MTAQLEVGTTYNLYCHGTFADLQLYDELMASTFLLKLEHTGVNNAVHICFGAIGI